MIDHFNQVGNKSQSSLELLNCSTDELTLTQRLWENGIQQIQTGIENV